MRLVALGNIDHDGVVYTQGEIIEDIKKIDGKRLVDLGVAKIIDTDEKTTEDDEKEKKKATGKKKATDDKE